MKHLQERQQTSTELFGGSFLRLLRDEVALPNGNVATREYLLHPGAVMVVPLLEKLDGSIELVLERQFRYPLRRVMIEFPAGKIDPGEDPLLCAQRELREETGYRANFWAKAGVLHPAISYCTEAIEIWFAKGLVAGQSQLDTDELLDVFNVTLKQLITWCQDGTITDAKTLVGAFWLQNMRSGAWLPDWRQVTA